MTVILLKVQFLFPDQFDKSEVGVQHHLQLALGIKVGVTVGTFFRVCWHGAYGFHWSSTTVLYPQICKPVSIDASLELAGSTHDADGQAVHVRDCAVDGRVDFKGG